MAKRSALKSTAKHVQFCESADILLYTEVWLVDFNAGIATSCNPKTFENCDWVNIPAPTKQGYVNFLKEQRHMESQDND